MFFIEEPVATDAAEPWLDRHAVEGGIQIVVPRLPASLAGPAADAAQRALLDQLLRERGPEATRPLLFHAIGAQVLRPRRRIAGGL